MANRQLAVVYKCGISSAFGYEYAERLLQSWSIYLLCLNRGVLPQSPLMATHLQNTQCQVYGYLCPRHFVLLILRYNETHFYQYYANQSA